MIHKAIPEQAIKIAIDAGFYFRPEQKPVLVRRLKRVPIFEDNFMILFNERGEIAPNGDYLFKEKVITDPLFERTFWIALGRGIDRSPIYMHQCALNLCALILRARPTEIETFWLHMGIPLNKSTEKGV
jgi:hypothetical protein